MQQYQVNQKKKQKFFQDYQTKQLEIQTERKIYIWGELSSLFKRLYTFKDLEEIEEIKNLINEEKIDESLLKNPKSICMGISHMNVLTERGNIISFGSNENYVLGTSNQKAKYGIIEDKFKKIRTNEAACAALQDNGKILYWGSYGSDTFKKPVNLRSSKKYVDVKIGLRHGLCLTAEGHISCFGVNNYLQLGYASKKKAWRDKPKELKNIPPIKKISSGNNHSCALTSDGQVFMWGKNLVSESSNSGIAPVLLTTDNEHFIFISKISCGPENICSIVDRKNLPTICYSFFNPPTIQCCSIDG